MPRKSHGRCIFCDGPGLSKEHILSDWLSKVLPGPPRHEMVIREIAQSAGEPETETGRRTQVRQGHIGQRKVRTVCKRCNNGWMSSVVDSAKPLAKRLIVAGCGEIDPNEFAELATWIAVACIMAEFDGGKIPVIPIAERKALFASKKPSDQWTISIGRYSGDKWRPIGLASRAKFLVRADNRLSEKLLVTTYTLGSLAIQACYSSDPEIVADYRNRGIPSGMLRIWPPPVQEPWPPNGHACGDEEMSSISDQYCNSIYPANIGRVM